MANGPEDKRMRKVAPMVWEVIGAFEKTAMGLRSIGRQRRYQTCRPLAPAPAPWPELDEARLSVVWKGRLCEFTPRQRYQYVLLRLLVEARGRWVEHTKIEEYCMGDKAASSDAIRQFKHRLAQTLRAKGMGDLAEAIEVNGESMRLKT